MSTRPNRETAYRVFAREFDDATLSYAESDEERAPNYVVTPTGARINRLFVVGVLTEIESVNDDQLRARIVDPTGAFVVYAGQYQPEALSFLERIEPPAFVAVTGKARTFQPEDSDRVFTSIRPETLSEVDAATRDRFTVDATERTTERVRTMTEALERDEQGDTLRETLEAEGVEAGMADGIARALGHYGTTQTYLDALGEMALDAARVVAGEREEVPPLGIAPDEGDSTERAAATDSAETDTEAEPASLTESADETGTKPAAETTGDGAAVSNDNAGVAVESESTADSDASGIETESSVEAESALETDEPTTVETASEPEQSKTEIEDEDIGDDSLEGTDEPADETAETETSGGNADETPTEADLDPEEFEIDDEERERIEDQYGTDFESAAEVDGPGEADIETPTPEESSAEPDPTEELDPTTSDTSTTETTETVETTETDTTEDTEPTADTSTEADAATESNEATESAGDETADIDPEEAVVAAMRELDDGDGAEREAVIESVVEDGLTREEAAEGIQSALMSGECYESEDDTFKPI